MVKEEGEHVWPSAYLLPANINTVRDLLITGLIGSSSIFHGHALYKYIGICASHHALVHFEHYVLVLPTVKHSALM